ncbi:hypothetical protein K439DRAFT_105839 [Ramaria rubella]|nr:hypothetical protein K439DRAFT_105839 [Ramaria rubella]
MSLAPTEIHRDCTSPEDETGFYFSMKTDNSPVLYVWFYRCISNLAAKIRIPLPSLDGQWQVGHFILASSLRNLGGSCIDDCSALGGPQTISRLHNHIVTLLALDRESSKILYRGLLLPWPQAKSGRKFISGFVLPLAASPTRCSAPRRVAPFRKVESD